MRGCRRLPCCALTVLLLVAGGCVSTATYEKKATEADTLGKELSLLRLEREEFVRGKSALELRQEMLAAQLLLLTEQGKKCAADLKSVELLLAAKEGDLSSSIDTLRRQLSELTGTNLSLSHEIDSILKNRSDGVRKTSSVYEELLGLMKDEIARGEATVSELKGTLTVTLFEPLLFEPGSIALKQSAGPTLLKLADYLKGVKVKEIRVEGETETVLSASWSLAKYPTGWELAAVRATTVTRFLQNGGVSPLLLSAVSHGEYRPLSDNISELGRTRNRRIQIVISQKE